MAHRPNSQSRLVEECRRREEDWKREGRREENRGEDRSIKERERKRELVRERVLYYFIHEMSITRVTVFT